MRTLVLMIAILARTAHADSSDDGSKSEALALGLAIGGTAIGPSLVMLAFDNDAYDTRLHAEYVPIMITGCAAIVLGPSLGNVYAGKLWSTGLGLRLAGGAVLGAGVASLYDPYSTEGDRVLLIAGIGLLVAGTALDLRDSVITTRAHNRAFVIAPLVGPISGLSVAGSF